MREPPSSLPVRVYVTGRLTVERGSARLETRDLPGRQGRLALTYLVLSRSRPVPRDELVGALWPASPPPSVDTALSALISKLRSGLGSIGLDDPVLTTNAGCYELRLPPGSVVDVESAANHLDRAEGALRTGDIARTWSGATVAVTVLGRPLLPGDDAPWLTPRRAALQASLVRAYDCLTEVWLTRGDSALAVAMAQAAVDLAPFRETGYRRLMQAHAAAGDRAEALRVYEACRVLLRDELGVNPSAQTEELFTRVLAESV